MHGLDAHEFGGQLSEEERRKIVNLSRSIVDAAQARVARNRPKGTFYTERGDYGTQRRAKQLDAFCAGVLDQSEFYGTRGLALQVRDSILLGDGGFKIVETVNPAKKAGAIRVDRVLPWRVLVDPTEAHQGRPRNKYEYHNINRKRLAAMFPEAEHGIGQTPEIETNGLNARHADEVAVYEAWHLPSIEGADDGKHIMCTDNVTLSVRPWKVERFPFVFRSWTEPTAGYWGQSLLEDIEVLDAEFNEMLYLVQQCLWHHANPWILKPREGDIGEMAIDNDVRGVTIEYSNGQAPQRVVGPSVPPDVARQAEWLRSTAYDQSGVSEASATSTKPAGLNSGAALREFNEQGSERFIVRGYGIESSVVDVDRRIIDAARRIDEDGADISVRAVRKRRRQSFVEKIKWSQVDLDEDAFVIKVAPGNSLQDLPGYKVAAIQEFYQNGALSNEQFMSLLDMPDLDGHLDLATAPYEIVLDQIDAILGDGKEELPDPHQDLTMALTMARNSYLRARIDGMEPERLEALRAYISTAEEMLRAASAPADSAPLAPAEAAPPATDIPPEAMAEEAMVA